MTPGSPPHRDGTMVAGGHGYSLGELKTLVPPRALTTGFASLDGDEGITAGSVWTIAAPAGAGVTTLATQIAASAAMTARVRLANGHMATHLLRDRTLAACHETASDLSGRARLQLASWAPLPGLDTPISDGWDGSDCDLLIIDTVDEMFAEPVWPTAAEVRLRLLRWLREHARNTDTAVVLTAGVNPPCAFGREAFEDAWAGHWARPVFADLSDVGLEMWQPGGGGADLHMLAQVRGARSWIGTVQRRPSQGSLLSINRDAEQ